MPPTDLELAIKRALPDLLGAWVPMAGGRTNCVWRVAEAVVVKHFDRAAASPLFPNDPLAEVAALTHFGPLGLAPRLLASGKEWLAYKYVRGAAWRCDVRPVAALLGRLHQGPPPKAAFRRLAPGALALRNQTAVLMNMVGLDLALPDIPPVYGWQACPLHGDVVAGNIIVSQDALCLVDWQCPAIGDPTEDIAAFLSPAMQTLYRGMPLDTDEVDLFLRTYPAPEVCDRYIALRPLFRLRMAAHCLWRARRGDAGFAEAAKAELYA